VPAPLSRLQQAVRRALEATALLWPEVVIGPGWLAEAAYVLANPDGADRATVEARYAVLLADMRDEATPSANLQAMAAQFTKVTARYGPRVFTGYDAPDLPRTHNDLEQLVGGLRHQLRRTTGQKNAPARWVGTVPLACRPPWRVSSTRLPLPSWRPPTSSRGGLCAPAGHNAAGPGCWGGGFGGIQRPICRPWKNT